MNQTDDAKLEVEDANSDDRCAIDCFLKMLAGAMIFFAGLATAGFSAGFSIVLYFNGFTNIPLLILVIIGLIAAWFGLKIVGRNIVQ